MKKGDKVIIVRTIESIFSKEIRIEEAEILSSGSKKTQLVGHYQKYWTASLARSIEEVEAANIVGIVIVKEENIDRAVAKVKALQEKSIKHWQEKLDKYPNTRRYEYALSKALKPFEVVRTVA